MWPLAFPESWVLEEMGVKNQKETDGKLVFTALIFIRRSCAGSNLSVLLSHVLPPLSYLASPFSPFTLFLPTFPKSKTGRLGMEVNSSIVSLEN